MVKEIRESIRQDTGDEFQFAISIAPSVSAEKFAEILSLKDEDLNALNALAAGSYHRIGDTVFVKGESLDLMASVSSAFVTSGTATLECALSKCPLCVAYRMSPISFQLAKRLVKLDHISLVNLVAGRALIKEFIQEFTFAEVGAELASLARDGGYRSSVLEGLHSLDDLVQGDLARRAALTVKAFLEGGA